MSAIPPMRCGEAATYLSALADGELTEPLRERVAAHVAGCEACAGELARHQTIDALVASLPATRPSPHVLDNVLAATRHASADPVVRESLRRPQRRILSRSLPAFLTTGMSDSGVRPVGHPSARKTRMSGALSALAATLLIAISFVAFNRLPIVHQLAAGTQRPTPLTVAGVLAQTQARVNAVRGQVAFTPVLPAYLPPNARLESVSVAPNTPTAAVRYLDVIWVLAPPLARLHMRESAESLSRRVDYYAMPATPALTWSLGAHQWTQGQVPYAHSNLAIGEDRGALSITLDIGVQGAANPTDATDPTNARAISVLRLTSLSLDAPYQPLPAQQPDVAHTVLYYEARAMTTSGEATWKVYYDQAGQREQLTVSLANGTLYTDVIVGGSALRLDPATKTYGRMSPSEAGGFASLRGDVLTFFNLTNSLLADGELWNLGPAQRNGEHVYKLALVGAPYPTFVYVDSATRRVVGADVDYGATTHPGTPQAVSHLSPTDACPRYSVISFMQPGSVPAGTFAAPALTGYRSGQVPTPLACVPSAQP